MKFDEALTTTQKGMESTEWIGDEFSRERGGTIQAAALSYLGRLGAGFDLANKRWLIADQLNDNVGSWMMTITACHQFIMLLDPAKAAAWVNRELAKPRIRIGRTSFVEKSLLEHLGLALVLMGNVAQAAGLVAQSPPRPLFGGYSLREHLAFYAGDWPGAELLVAQSMNEEIRAHFRLQLCVRALLAARLLRVQGRQPEAEAILEKTLAVRSTGPGALIELVARQELALGCVDSGRLAQAQMHLARCREIMAAGEDWRGLAGCVARGPKARAPPRRGVSTKPMIVSRSQSKSAAATKCHSKKRRACITGAARCWRPETTVRRLSNWMPPPNSTAVTERASAGCKEFGRTLRVPTAPALPSQARRANLLRKREPTGLMPYSPACSANRENIGR